MRDPYWRLVGNAGIRVIYPLKTAIDSTTHLLEKEIAGKGLTSIPGNGSEAKALRDEIASLKISLQKAEADKSAMLRTFDSMAFHDDYEGLQQRFAVDLPQNSIIERSAAKEPILASRDGKRYELAVTEETAMISPELDILNGKIQKNEAVLEQQRRLMSKQHQDTFQLFTRTAGSRKSRGRTGKIKNLRTPLDSYIRGLLQQQLRLAELYSRI